jgi:hypothetical protein
MKSQFLRGIIAILFFASCSNEKDNSEKLPEENLHTETSKTTNDDSALVRSVVMDFYNWYNKNYEKFQDYKLYSGIKKEGVPPYKINWDEVKKYQDFIRASVPYLGEGFLANQTAFFKQCDSAFKVDINDDIPYGFDYDWYTNSQEDPQYLLDEVNKKDNKWVIMVSGNEVSVIVNNAQYQDYGLVNVFLEKENDKWVIVKIGIE